MPIDLGDVDLLHGPASRTIDGQPAIAREPCRSERRRAQDAPAGRDLSIPGLDDFAGFGNLGLARLLLAPPLLRACARLRAFQLAPIDTHLGMVLPAGTHRYSERLLFSGLPRTWWPDRGPL